ncbi:MAG: hypothetical protein MJ085_02410 [Clostridia bacterium]|nr:hypothetical protein [Clostridia bacterium]
MKKHFAILLVFALLILLAACTQAPEKPKKATEQVSTQTAVLTEAVPTEQTASQTEAPPEEAPFPETVLLEYKSVKVTAIGCEAYSANSVHINLKIENPDGLRLSVSELYINNIALPSGNVNISEGSGYISIVLDPLFVMGLDFDALQTFELRLGAQDADGEVHKGELAAFEIPGAKACEPTTPGALLFEENGVSLYAQLKTDDSFWGTCVYFYCINSSGKTMRIGAGSQPTYNGGSSGVEAGSVASGNIYDGRASVFVTNLYDDQLQAAGIYPITSVAWTFNVYDAEAESLWFSPGAFTITEE